MFATLGNWSGGVKKLCVVILNYRRADLTLQCLRSLEPELAGNPDWCAVVVDNGSDDQSTEQIDTALRERCWSQWCQLVRSETNGGFAAGNNLGFQAVEAEAYLLLNSDTCVRPGSITRLLHIMQLNPRAGLIGPRLETPDGEPQISCFRVRSPLSEFLAAAATGPMTRLLRCFDIGIPVRDEPHEPPRISLAAVLIRREVIEQVGSMDEEYFMYFEDIDYCRRVRQAGWTILHDPSARIVHLRGGSSSVKTAITNRDRIPSYYYESRSRYFAKFYGGRFGLWLTNLLWLAGRSISRVRELVGNKRPHICAFEARDNWTNWWSPMQPPAIPSGDEL